jgi:hypothetical protein
LNEAIWVIGFDATSSEHFGLFNAISGSWAHEEELGAIGRLDACAGYGAPAKLAIEYVVKHLKSASEDRQSSASYYFANFSMGCGLDSILILMDSDKGINYHAIASPSSLDLTSHQINDVHSN